jgi:diguanylate cyclase with GGDEF domain
MSELPDQPPSQRRAPRNGRRARFAMPAEHHDERVGEVIEAFLDGPPERARRVARPRSKRVILRAVRAPASMDTRPDWDNALRHEDARLARYGRPVSILVIRMRMPTAGAEDRYAGRVGAIVRQHTRETDRVTRAAADRFHVLLPETDGAEANLLAERVRDACAKQIRGRAAVDFEIRAAAVSPGSGETLHDALRIAQEAVAD